MEKIEPATDEQLAFAEQNEKTWISYNFPDLDANILREVLSIILRLRAAEEVSERRRKMLEKHP